MAETLARYDVVMPANVPHKSNSRLRGPLRGAMPLMAVLFLWELVARMGIFSPVLFPPFSTVMVKWGALVASGGLLIEIATTACRAATGFALAIVIGTAVGLAMARIQLVNWFFKPLIAVGFPMPTVILIPLFTAWFGIGNTPEITLVTLTCFFPIALSTAAGARGVEQHILWSAWALGTGKSSALRRIILPASLPFIFNAARMALPLALIMSFVVEMVSGDGGLGYALVYGYRFLDTPAVFAILLTVLVVGFLLDHTLVKCRRFLVRWDAESGKE